MQRREMRLGTDDLGRSGMVTGLHLHLSLLEPDIIRQYLRNHPLWDSSSTLPHNNSIIYIIIITTATDTITLTPRTVLMAITPVGEGISPMPIVNRILMIRFNRQHHLNYLSRKRAFGHRNRLWWARELLATILMGMVLLLQLMITTLVVGQKECPEMAGQDREHGNNSSNLDSRSSSNLLLLLSFCVAFIDDVLFASWYMLLCFTRYHRVGKCSCP